jgi:hypothetical protein
VLRRCPMRRLDTDLSLTESRHFSSHPEEQDPFLYPIEGLKVLTSSGICAWRSSSWAVPEDNVFFLLARISLCEGRNHYSTPVCNILRGVTTWHPPAELKLQCTYLMNTSRKRDWTLPLLVEGQNACVHLQLMIGRTSPFEVFGFASSDSV